MNVRVLISALSSMPLETKVVCVWDGEPRSDIDDLWLAKDGYVVLISKNESCYSDGARPKDAPTSKERPYWPH